MDIIFDKADIKISLLVFDALDNGEKSTHFFTIAEQRQIEQLKDPRILDVHPFTVKVALSSTNRFFESLSEIESKIRNAIYGVRQEVDSKDYGIFKRLVKRHPDWIKQYQRENP